MGEPPHNPLGGDHSSAPWQRTGALASLGEGGPTHPDDTLGEVL